MTRGMTTCTTCRLENSNDASYCGRCGAELQSGALIVSRPKVIQIRETRLATPQVKALVATVAVSAATLLVEAGLNYVQRRIVSFQRPSFSLRRRKPATKSAVIVPKTPAPPYGRVITVVAERIVEEKRWGRPARRVIERFAWRGEE